MEAERSTSAASGSAQQARELQKVLDAAGRQQVFSTWRFLTESFIGMSVRTLCFFFVLPASFAFFMLPLVWNRLRTPADQFTCVACPPLELPWTNTSLPPLDPITYAAAAVAFFTVWVGYLLAGRQERFLPRFERWVVFAWRHLFLIAGPAYIYLRSFTAVLQYPLADEAGLLSNKVFAPWARGFEQFEMNAFAFPAIAMVLIVAFSSVMRWRQHFRAQRHSGLTDAVNDARWTSPESQS